MRLEHLFDLDLRYEGEYVVVRPYGGLDGVGYAAGAGRATGPRVEGAVRFSNNPRVRGDGVLLADARRRDRDRRRRPDRLLARRASAARTRTAAASASPSQ